MKIKDLSDTDLELHVAELVHDLSHLFSDNVVGDFVVTLGCSLDCVSRHFIESDDILQHSSSFIKWAESMD